eukprot:TRINITY_DN17578_c0_g1_i1.p1 TRINITY_DN17578_c0_g1~~TRINITY_DN17578_c0_g1_i1.p1  ORF type:complete len:792 (+),score=146.91 TRINITY_DN17578_c0_g1_i1:186-2561(+)
MWVQQPYKPTPGNIAGWIFLGILGTWMLHRRNPELQTTRFEQHELSPAQEFDSFLRQHRSMRGGGDPVAFQWLFQSGAAAGVPAGSVVRTRLLALDAQGRPARRCEHIHVNVSVGGHGRLSNLTALRHWVNSELAVDFVDEVAELLDASIRISINNQEMFTHRSQFRFNKAPVRYVQLSVRPVVLSSKAGSSGGNTSNRTWPTLVVHEILVSAQDHFGNEIAGSDLAGDDNGICNGFAIQSSSRFVDVLSGGQVSLNSKGEASVLVRSRAPGTVEFRLVPLGGNAVSSSSRTLMGGNLQVRFADPPGAGINTASSHVVAGPNRSDDKWVAMAQEVKEAFLHAWQGYKRYAWGTDELQPLSKKGKDTFGNIGMTILDSLTTLWLMDLKHEFDEGAAFVESELDFDTADREISVFEVVIRALGGLLGAHALSGRPAFLERALELGERLLPALNSTSGFPMPRWNLARGLGKTTYNAASEPTILAEAGSLQLEFRYLSAVSGDMRFSKAAEVCSEAIRATGASGILPVHLSPPEGGPPKIMNDNRAMGALADSYYEYLLKQWLQSPEETQFKDEWMAVMDDLPSLVHPDPRKESSEGSKLQLTEMDFQGGRIWKMDHLSCFVPGMAALGLMNVPKGDIQGSRNASWFRMAEGLTASCMHLWKDTKTGLAPEYVLLHQSGNGEKLIEGSGKHSFLRPETAESLFYLYRLTGHNRYRKWGKNLFHAIVEHAKVPGGYASVKDVNKIPTEKMDEMQSFVMAETLKYLYLLFSPPETLDLERFVLNTEGHPFRTLRSW